MSTYFLFSSVSSGISSETPAASLYVLQALAVEELGRHAVMIVGEHVGQRAAEVPEETIAHFGALHHATRQYGEIGRGIVAAALLKLGDHLVGPVLHARFPTIEQNVAQTLAIERAERLRDRIGVAAQIVCQVLRTELVNFVTQTGGHRRAVLGARQRVAQTQDRPTSRRNFPVELAVLDPSSTSGQRCLRGESSRSPEAGAWELTRTQTSG